MRAHREPSFEQRYRRTLEAEISPPRFPEPAQGSPNWAEPGPRFALDPAPSAVPTGSRAKPVRSTWFARRTTRGGTHELAPRPVSRALYRRVPEPSCTSKGPPPRPPRSTRRKKSYLPQSSWPSSYESYRRPRRTPLRQMSFFPCITQRVPQPSNLKGSVPGNSTP